MSRELNFVLKESLRNGLRPDHRVQRNTPWMVNMANAKPTEYGCVSPETVVNPMVTPTATVTWPFPQLFRGERTTLLCGETALYSVAESTWTGTAISTYNAASQGSTLAISAGGLWQHASFQDVYFLTNGVSLVCKLPSATSNRVLVANSPTVQAIGQHGNRLFFGGVATTYFSDAKWTAIFNSWKATLPEDRFVHEDLSIDTGWVFWSEKGGGADDVPFHTFMAMFGFLGSTEATRMAEVIAQEVERHRIGMTPVRTPGTVQVVKALGNNIMVYGDKGVSVLIPDGNGYREEVIGTVGVLGRGAVGGTDVQHVWVDTYGSLWRLNAGSFVPEHLNYREFLSNLTASETIISFDPVEFDYWIADGTYCYVLTHTGLGGSMTVRPTSLFRDCSGRLVGPALGIPTTKLMQLESQEFDLAERASKHIVLYQLEYSGMTQVKTQTKYRRDVDTAWKESTWMPTTREGVSHSAVSFVDGRTLVRGVVTSNDSRVQRIEVRYIGEDKSARRGTKGIPEEN